jgi:hypothetical protein
MTDADGEMHSDALRLKRTEDSEDVGRRYHFDHLALRLVLRDMYFDLTSHTA